MSVEPESGVSIPRLSEICKNHYCLVVQEQSTNSRKRFRKMEKCNLRMYVYASRYAILKSYAEMTANSSCPFCDDNVSFSLISLNRFPGTVLYPQNSSVPPRWVKIHRSMIGANSARCTQRIRTTLESRGEKEHRSLSSGPINRSFVCALNAMVIWRKYFAKLFTTAFRLLPAYGLNLSWIVVVINITQVQITIRVTTPVLPVPCLTLAAG